ncbi:uncharacterized protein LOC130674506 [Microplitis mediator]|uniref:uncharacterized protein LOC130674506 n=1 Tax=Microplitis mediator TaxID=375433 RepID=UPI002554A53F|nr:uncharacterized protein LOC130674506 [Microplitis mediator]
MRVCVYNGVSEIFVIIFLSGGGPYGLGKNLRALPLNLCKGFTRAEVWYHGGSIPSPTLTRNGRSVWVRMRSDSWWLLVRHPHAMHAQWLPQFEEGGESERKRLRHPGVPTTPELLEWQNRPPPMKSYWLDTMEYIRPRPSSAVTVRDEMVDTPPLVIVDEEESTGNGSPAESHLIAGSGTRSPVESLE